MRSFIVKTFVALAALYTLGGCVGPSKQIRDRISDSDLEITVDQDHLTRRQDSSLGGSGLEIVYNLTDTGSPRSISRFDDLSGKMVGVGSVTRAEETTVEYFKFGSDSPLYGLVEITRIAPNGQYKRELVHKTDPQVEGLFQ